jgi:hypothetical protein
MILPRSYALLLLLVFPALAGALRMEAAEPAPALEKTAVTVPKAALLPQALAAVRRATGRAVLAEPNTVERKLPGELRQAPLPQVLEELSASYDLYWRARPGALVFNRRYRDAKEIPDLEVEEMAAIMADLAGLVHPFAPYPLDEGYIRDKNRFAQTLTGPQMEQMRKEGLPFALLTPEQKTHWLRVNAANGYCDPDLYWARVARQFARWKEDGLVSRPGADGAGPVLFFAYPDEQGQVDGEMVQFTFPSYRGGATPPSSREGEGEILPGRAHRLPSALSVPVDLPEGETTLAALAGAIGEAVHTKVRVPAYARDRLLLAYADGASAATLLTALEDLYGWTARLERGRVVLERPRPAPPAGARELHRAVVAAFPPSLRLLFRSEYEKPELAIPRAWAHQDPLVEELHRLRKPGWTRFPVREMPRGVQNDLGMLVLLAQLRSASVPAYAGSPEPPWWLVAPEEGVFTLEGAGQHPGILFHVRRPDGHNDGWGWGIGTSTLRD